MISNPEGFTDNSPIYPMTSTPVKKPSTIKSLCLFTNILDVKKESAYRWVGAAKYECKEIKYGTTPWSLKQNQKGNSKIDDQVKKSHYNYIMRNPQVVQSPIVNYFLKVNIDGHTENQLVKNCYCRCPSENFVTALLLTHTMVDSNIQDMHRII